MSNTWKTLSKILVVFCLLCGVYFWAMVSHSNSKLEEAQQLQKMQELEDQKTIEAAKAWEAQLQQEIEDIKTANAEQLAALEDANTVYKQLQTDLETAEALKTEKELVVQGHQADVDYMNGLYDTILETRKQYGEKVRQLEEMIVADETDVKICYLTFDDGPNNLTQAIVEKLAEHEVYATFFTIGTNKADGQAENLRREMMGGHTIANHTYSHYYNGSLYRELAIFTNQVNKQDQKVFDATGFHTQLFRFPSGSTFCPFKEDAIKWLEENGYKWADWNASAWDSGFHSMDASGEKISSNVLHTVKGLDIAVVLLHDFNYGTYDSLDIFIPQLKEQGYIFLPMFPESIMLESPMTPV